MAAAAAPAPMPSGHQYVPWARSDSIRGSQPSSAKRSWIHSAARRSPAEAEGRSIAESSASQAASPSRSFASTAAIAAPASTNVGR